MASRASILRHVKKNEAITDWESREVGVRRSREEECDLLVFAYIVLVHKRGKKKKETGRTVIFDVGSLFICCDQNGSWGWGK